MEETWELAAVSTDAKALYNFLNASKGVPGTKKIGEFAADYLKFDPKEELGEAIMAIQGLAFRVSQKISKLDLPVTEKDDVFAYFQPFQPLIDYTTFGKDINWARSVFFRDGKVGKLLILDGILAGLVGHAPELDDRDRILSDLDNLIEVVNTSTLPEKLRKAVAVRLLQIRASLRNYEIFGSESVVEETANVLGVVSLYSSIAPEADINATDAVTKLREFGGRIVKGVSKTRDFVDDLEFLSDAGSEAVSGLLTDMSDQA